MESIKTERGFVVVEHPVYVKGDPRLIQESSACGDYEDAFEKPGSSFLWIGMDHHLNREEVAELVGRMQHWLATGRLKVRPNFANRKGNEK